MIFMHLSIGFQLFEYFINNIIMTLHYKDKNQVYQEQIQTIIKRYHKAQVTVQQYCELAQIALTLHLDKLYESYKEFMQSPDRNVKENYKMLAGFLCSPNIKFTLNEKDIIFDENKLEVGQKIMNTISYAWDNYFHLIKDNKQINLKRQQKKGIDEIYSQNNDLITAKKHLIDMLNEMNRNKYHWQNYTKQNILSRQADQKQINQQQTLMRLLLNILESQSQTMKQHSIKVQLQGEGIIRIQQKQTENQVSVLKQEIKQNKKDLKKIFNLSSYFQKKFQSLQSKTSIISPITKIQEQRNFNSDVFKRYLYGEGK